MKMLEAIFGVVFTVTGISGLIGMMIWAIGGPKDAVHWSVFGTLAFVLVLIAGILLVNAGERK